MWSNVLKTFLKLPLNKMWACVNQKKLFHSFRYLMIQIFQWSCYLLSGGEVGNCQRCDAGWASVRSSTVGPHYRLVTLVESVVWLVLVAQLYRPRSQLTGQRGQLGVVEAVSAQQTVSLVAGLPQFLARNRHTTLKLQQITTTQSSETVHNRFFSNSFMRY